MAGWQAGLLLLVQTVLQHLHVLLPASTAAYNLKTTHDHLLAQDHSANKQGAWLAGKQGY